MMCVNVSSRTILLKMRIYFVETLLYDSLLEIYVENIVWIFQLYLDLKLALKCHFQVHY